MEALEPSFKTARTLTSILLLIPYGLLILYGMGFFSITLLPLSIVALIIHFILGKKRRRYKLRVNEWDNMKIFIGIAHIPLGIVLWAVMALVMSS